MKNILVELSQVYLVSVENESASTTEGHWNLLDRFIRFREYHQRLPEPKWETE